MLKVVRMSQAAKVEGCAATYRAGEKDVFGTCPKSCALLPKGRAATSKIDTKYVETLMGTCPRKGRSYLYSHFHFSKLPTEGATVFNFSADRPSQMVEAFEAKYPTVIVLPAKRTAKIYKIQGIKVVGCPAEYSRATCKECNMCMRWKRDYVVGFHAHGNQKKLAENPDKEGGCFGVGARVMHQWKGTQTSHRSIEEEVLPNWALTLPRGTTLRNHIVGDVGEDK